MPEMSFDERRQLEDLSSLCEWYPRIKDAIPTPKTEILELNKEEIRNLYRAINRGEKIMESLVFKIGDAASKIGYPLFLRSDQGSGKHDWKDTCYVKSELYLLDHVLNLIRWHESAGIMGMRFKALVFREFLDLETTFTAFHTGMPVAKERRYFVRNGEVTCHHPYWPHDAIYGASINNWEPLLDTLNKDSDADVKILTTYAKIFYTRNLGFWSVDFALQKDGLWVLIDAARGEVSWHPEECPMNPDHDELMREKAERKKTVVDFESMLVKKEN